MAAQASFNTDLLARTVVGEAAFRPRSREVTNWRIEAARHLAAPPEFAFSVLIGQTPASVSRCVKLNNYWCIKRAGWAGEIASDNEGHVAFSSAADGARTAARLLRRYYVDFGRRSAMAIVSHWAPAQCGLSAGGRSRALAVRGLGATLRGRWLAAHRGRAGARAQLRRSVVPDRTIPMMRTPTIEAGVTEVPLATPNLAALVGAEPKAGAGARSAPVASCASETRRIASYAVRASAGVAANVNDDLKLFDAGGRATPNLARMMANMAAVEIGPLKADADLVADAVAKADAAAAPAAADEKAPARRIPDRR